MNTLSNVAPTIPPTSSFPALECPDCGRLTDPTRVNKDLSVRYDCPAENHEAIHGQARTWRITKFGAMDELVDGKWETC